MQFSKSDDIGLPCVSRRKNPEFDGNQAEEGSPTLSCVNDECCPDGLPNTPQAKEKCRKELFGIGRTRNDPVSKEAGSIKFINQRIRCERCVHAYIGCETITVRFPVGRGKPKSVRR